MPSQPDPSQAASFVGQSFQADMNLDYSSPPNHSLTNMGPIVMGQPASELKEGIWWMAIQSSVYYFTHSEWVSMQEAKPERKHLSLNNNYLITCVLYYFFCQVSCPIFLDIFLLVYIILQQWSQITLISIYKMYFLCM